MRGKNKNAIINAWKRVNNDQKNMIYSQVNQTINSAAARTGQSFRNGQLGFGALQLTNYIYDDYIVMGGRGSGTVGS